MLTYYEYIYTYVLQRLLSFVYAIKIYLFVVCSFYLTVNEIMLTDTTLGFNNVLVNVALNTINKCCRGIVHVN